LKDRASLDAACRGVAAVITTASTTLSRQPGDSLQNVDLEGQLQLIEAARTAGVPRFLYVSFSHNNTIESPLKTAKRTVEERLKRSGLSYTILAPSFFMEVWLGPALGFDIASAKAQIFGEGHNPISWISLEDVATFAVLCLDHSEARNATIELGGPEALSPLDVVKAAEGLCGRSFDVQNVPETALSVQHRTATDPFQQTFAALMLAYAKGDPIDMQQTLKTFPVELLSVNDYTRRVLRR
jgi:uncharacterized protein YbjT (DUF2867 family)